MKLKQQEINKNQTLHFQKTKKAKDDTNFSEYKKTIKKEKQQPIHERKTKTK